MANKKLKNSEMAKPSSAAMVRWPSKNEIDGETKQLIEIVENGWAWKWPGWSWVTKMLNYEYGNNRTSSACRHKYNRILKTTQHNINNSRECGINYGLK